MKNSAECFTSKWFRSTPARLAAWHTANITQLAAQTSEIPARDTFPEPLDIGDHLGNTKPSFMIGAIAGIITTRVIERVNPNMRSATARATIVAAATATGAVINSLAEFKFGQRLLGEAGELILPHNTLDPLDAAYGAAAAGVSSFVVTNPSIKASREQHPTSVSLNTGSINVDG